MFQTVVGDLGALLNEEDRNKGPWWGYNRRLSPHGAESKKLPLGIRMNEVSLLLLHP